jgi:hypothetical protein
MLSLRSIGQVWFWSRDCRPVSDTRWVGQDLAIGTHLVTSRRGYTHHGIYVGRGMVVHYAGLSRFLRSGPIEDAWPWSFCKAATSSACGNVRREMPLMEIIFAK